MARRLTCIGAAVVLVCAAGGCMTAHDAHVARGGDEIVGLDVTPYWNNQLRFDERMADDIAACGVRWLRINFRRDNATDTINWEAYDTILARCRARGLAVLGLICYDGKLWHSTNEWSEPDWQAAFVARAEEIVRRYHAQIGAWEIWNEPIRLGALPPEALARLQVNAYQAIKAIDPHATVVFGAFEWPYYDTTNYLEQVYDSAAFQDYHARHGAFPFDVLSLHPYAMEYDPRDYLAAQISTVRAVMNARGERWKRIWLTELGWSNTDTWLGVQKGSQAANDRHQAQYAADAYRIVAEMTEPGYEQYGPYVERMFYFAYEDNPFEDGLFGLRAFRADPADELGAAKPVWTALCAQARRLPRNLARGAAVLAASGACVPGGEARRINDQLLISGWRAAGHGPHYLVLDLGSQARITGYTLAHAELAGAPPAHNTRAAHIETADSPGGPWRRCASFGTPDGAPLTYLPCAQPVLARYVRLVVTQPGDGGAHIAEWQVWGEPD